MMATTVVKFREVQRCWETSAEVVVPVPLKPVPVHISWNSTVAKRYRYRSNRYRYPYTEKRQYQIGTGTKLTGIGTDMYNLRELSRITILMQGYVHPLTINARSQWKRV